MYEAYCLLTGGRCSYHPIMPELSSFFISEPYDEKRDQREQAILKAIKGHPSNIADNKVMNISLACKICQQIQSSMFGIVDITGFNENVLIELGMLYGFNKPVVILAEKKWIEKAKLEIPTNIVGIEQVRYGDFHELTSQLEKASILLLKLQSKPDEYIVSMRPMLRHYIRELEDVLDAKKLGPLFRGKIISLKVINDVLVAIINKGTSHGVRKNIRFKVFRADKKVGRAYVEEEVGELIVIHAQMAISQCQPFTMDQDNIFWKDFSARDPLRNVVRPSLSEKYERMTEVEIERTITDYKGIQAYISLGGV